MGPVPEDEFEEDFEFIEPDPDLMVVLFGPPGSAKAFRDKVIKERDEVRARKAARAAERLRQNAT